MAEAESVAAEQRLQFRARLGTFARSLDEFGAMSSPRRAACMAAEPGLWDLLRSSDWGEAMKLLASEPSLASRALHISQTDLLYPLHYALEWGAPLPTVAALLHANPGAARSAKSEFLPVNRAIDTALNLFTRRLLTTGTTESQVGHFIATGGAAEPTEQPQPANALAELFQETEAVLAALLTNIVDEVVVLLHSANWIQQTCTVVLARALRHPSVRVRRLRLGERSLRDKYRAGLLGMVAVARTLEANCSLEELDLSCCAANAEPAQFSQEDEAAICAAFAAAAIGNSWLHTLKMPFALQAPATAAAAPPAQAALLLRCLSRNEELRSKIAASQRLCLASGLHPRLGVGSSIFPLSADLLEKVGNELCNLGAMSEGAERPVLRRYLQEPGVADALRADVGAGSSSSASSSSGSSTSSASNSEVAETSRGHRSLSDADDGFEFYCWIGQGTRCKRRRGDGME